MPGLFRRSVVGIFCLGAFALATQTSVLPVAGAGPATFHGLTPARLLDTRPGNPTIDGLRSGEGPLGTAGRIDLTIAGRGGVPATGASAVALNVTAAGATGVSYLTVWPTGLGQPTASNLNVTSPAATPNMVIVPLGSGGQVSIYNDAGNTDVIVDVLGWFPPGDVYKGLVPARFLDTRPNGSTVDDAWVRTLSIGSGSDTEVQMLGRGEVPSTGASAVAINVTVTDPTRISFLTVFPSLLPRPPSSTINFTPGATVANMAIVPIGSNGRIDVWNNDGLVYGIVDVLGYFPSGSSFVGLLPTRLMDTRPFNPTVDMQFSGAGPIKTNTATSLLVAGRGGVPSSGVGAVVLNVTVSNPTVTSFLTVWPSGVAQPTASNLNFVPRQTVANMVIVPVGADGKVSLYNSVGQTDAIVDVLGWFPTE